MTQSHPPSLTTLVMRTLSQECSLPRGAGVLVAVSGGPDSLALLHVLSALRQRLDLRLFACGVDHGLRPAAARELELAAEASARWEVPFRAVAVEVSPGGNLQARARDARYAALEAVRSELDLQFLATAHHAADRAETVLLRLLRGAGPAGLAVLPPRQGHLLRPLVRAPKSAVLSHLAQHQIAYATDPSNIDPRFLRVRIRTELLPLMQELSPGILAHLCSLADELAEPELPPILDEKGVSIRLNRSQRSELRKALRDHSRRASVLLPGGRVLRLDSRTGQPRVEEAIADSPGLLSESTEVPANVAARPVKNPKTG